MCTQLFNTFLNNKTRQLMSLIPSVLSLVTANSYSACLRVSCSESSNQSEVFCQTNITPHLSYETAWLGFFLVSVFEFSDGKW